ncbi:MAG TPA: hypothetical protein VKE29_08220 [Candidatus Udaeobacter sp.]|nr:hypothetical protein [Candidatus Udaeobacter sp.]
MNNVASELAAEPLLFSWDSARRRGSMLAAFLVLSLVAHALCFYLFQIVYPTPVALLPPPARVTFIAPDSEEGRTLLRWIDAEDPAVAFTTLPAPGARLGALPKTEHLPSYSAVGPMLKELPTLKPDLRIPSSRPPSAVHFASRKTASVRGSAKTYISFSRELDQFGVPSPPKSEFAASNEDAPEALRFRVAVNDLGEIRYCFPINSSGDPALDEQARLQVVRSRFPQNRQPGDRPDSALVWGMATVQWGSDVARLKQAPVATVTP